MELPEEPAVERGGGQRNKPELRVRVEGLRAGWERGRRAAKNGAGKHQQRQERSEKPLPLP